MSSLPTRSTGTDHVTGLCSRGELEGRLAQLLPPADTSSESAVALLLCDVVGLKEVNDRDGFHAGDAVLAAASRRLQDVSREAALLARLGGDELIAVFLGPDSEKHAAAAAAALSPIRHPSSPRLRTAWGTAAAEETADALIDRLYASMRAS